MSYNQQYLVAAQMGHQQVQVQQHAVAEIAHQQVRRVFLFIFISSNCRGHIFQPEIISFLGRLILVP